MPRVLIDTKVKEDANNVYLPQTEMFGGSVATGGKITIDSVLVPEDSYAIVSFDLSSIVDFTIFNHVGGNNTLVISDFNIIYDGNVGINFSNLAATNTEELIILLKDIIDKSFSIVYTLGTWTPIKTTVGGATSYELNLDDVSKTLSVRYNIVGDSYNFIPISVIYTTDYGSYEEYVLINNESLFGGSSALGSTFTFDFDDVVFATVVEGIDYSSGLSNVNTLAQGIANKINAEVNFIPDGATVVGGTISLETKTNVNTYNGDVISIKGLPAEAKASGSFIIVAGAPIGVGTIDFSIGVDSIAVALDGTEVDEVEVMLKIQNAFLADPTWDYEYFNGNVIQSKTNGKQFNGTMYFVTDTGMTFNTETESGVGVGTFILSGGVSSLITTSGNISLLGGNMGSSALTSTLDTIALPRKSFVTDKIYLKGFGGYILVDSLPVVTNIQNDILSIVGNIHYLQSGKGIGFQDLLYNIGNNNPYYNVFLRVNQDGGGSLSISNIPSEHLVFKIWKSVGEFINVSRVTLDTPPKNTTTGWTILGGSEVPLIVDGDGFSFPEDRFLVMTYPEIGSGVLAFSLNINNTGNIGNTVVSKIVTGDNVNAIDTLFANKRWVRGILSTPITDITLGLIKTEGDE